MDARSVERRIWKLEAALPPRSESPTPRNLIEFMPREDGKRLLDFWESANEAAGRSLALAEIESDPAIARLVADARARRDSAAKTRNAST
jgi:hypothetical protein